MLPDGNVGLVIADVCDKGVGSALYMALFRSLIRVFAAQAIHCTGVEPTPIQLPSGDIESISPSANDPLARLAAVSSTNNYIAHIHGRECMYATMFFGVLNPSTGILSYVNGGHEPLYVLNAGSIKDRLKPTGPAVGLFAQTEFAYKKLTLQPGDILFGYTDGVLDARSHKGARFTKKRLTELLSKPVDSVLEMMGNVGTDLFAHIGKAPQEDDVTMLALRRNKTN